MDNNDNSKCTTKAWLDGPGACVKAWLDKHRAAESEVVEPAGVDHKPVESLESLRAENAALHQALDYLGAAVNAMRGTPRNWARAYVLLRSECTTALEMRKDFISGVSRKGRDND